MRFKKENGLYRSEYYMGCMGIEDGFPPNRSNVSAVRKGVMSPVGGGGTTGGSAGSAGGSGTFGQEDVGSSSASVADYILMGAWGNDTGGTGTTATVSLYMHTDSASTTAKVAIYSNLSGHPQTLLGSSAEFNPATLVTVSGFYDFAIDLGANTIDNGSTYWLAFWANNVGATLVYAREGSGGDSSYKSVAYSGTWPTPFTEDGNGALLYSIHCDITW